MDTTTAPQPAAPAAVTPTPAPAAPVVTPVNSVTGKPVSEAAHNLFKMLEQSGDPMRETPDTPETPAVAEPEKKEAPPVAAPAVEPEKPIKVSKKPAPKRPELPAAASEPAAPAAAPAAVTPAAPDAKWEESLLDDEKAALEDARFAEKVNPKHKGLADKMGKFFRDQKEYLEKHPDADENDPGYKRILAQQPALTATDKREISAARIAEPIRKEYDGKLTDLQHELYVRDEEPKVEKEALQIRQHLAFNALPKEMLDVMKEKGLPVLQKEYADELEVAGGLINAVVDDAKELLRITRIDPKTKRSLASVAADPSHPKWDQHNRISSMVNEACADFQKNAPQAEQVRDGKWFVTREEWAKLPPQSRAQFWTFTNSEDHVREMIGRVLGWQKDFIAAELKKREDGLKARGWERKRPVAAAPATPAVAPVASTSVSAPRPSPSPSPATTGGATQKTLGQQLAARLAGE